MKFKLPGQNLILKFCANIRFVRNKAVKKLVYSFVLSVLIIANIFSYISQTTNAAAGINRTINFQGKLVNGDGTNTTNGSKSIIFSIYSVSSGGAALWSETQSVTTTDGIFRVALGSVTPFASLIDFNSDALYLGVKVGSDAEMTPRIQLTSVPYALNAEKVGGLTVTNTTGTLTIPNGKTVSFADSFTTTGAFGLTLTTTGTSTLTLPSGTETLVGRASTDTLTNKTIGSTGLVFSGATTDVTTGTNEAFTVTPNGSGDTVFTLDSDTNVQFTASAAPGVDLLAISNSGFGTTTTAVDGIDLTFIQADDADATDTNAGLNINITNSSGDADTLYGINIAAITGGAATEYALNIGSGWDRGISTGSALYVTGGGANITGGLTLNTTGATFSGVATDIQATSGEALTINATSNNIALQTTTSGDITLTTAAGTGIVNILTGNLKVGNGTPGVALNGEDAYIEGTLELDGAAQFDGGLTITTGALAVNSDSITSDGTLTINGATGQTISTTAGNITFQAAGTSTIANVQIGAGGVGSATPDLFGLDVKSTTGDPAGGFEGAMYYNTFDNKFRCYQNTGWVDCIGAGSSGPFTDGAGITYLTDTAEDFAVGGTTLASAFSVDVSANAVRIGTGSTANAGLTMYASDGDTGSLTYNTNDEFAFDGGGLTVTQTGTALSSNGIMKVDWSPASTASIAGSLFTLNIGSNGNAGLLFNITDNGNSLFSVSETGIISSLPHAFNAPGDVGIAYDLVFTNQTASYLKSNAPLQIEAGELFESNNLTLKTYNSGQVVLDGAGGVILNTGAIQYTGNARPTKTIVLNPEYAGATFTTDGSSSTNGSMTSDNVGSGSAWRNYYEWTSTQATLQDYTIAVRVTLPEDFSAWNTTAFSIDYQTGTSSTADNTVTVNISNATNTPGTPMCTTTASASTSWATQTCSDSNLTNWNSTDKSAVIRIKVAAKNTASAKARVGAITLSYKAKF